MAIPAYLFTGPEAGERNEAIENLRSRLKKACGDIDEHICYADDTRIADVVSLLENESLFAAARFIVLNNAELIKKKEDIDLLKDWLSAAEKNTGIRSTLILVSAETGVDKKLENLLPKENRTIFWELFDDRKAEWLRKFFAKAGYGIEADAIDSILDLIENNTESLGVECSRFFLCFDKGHTVTESDVEKVLTHNREESAFTLFDALTDVSRSPQGRLEAAADIFQQIRAAKDGSPQKIIAGLTYCFRRLRDWQVFVAKNSSPSPLDFKIAGFASKKAQTQYRNASRLWNPRQGAAVLALLAKTDSELRESGSGLDGSLMFALLYALVIKKGCALEAAPEMVW